MLFNLIAVMAILPAALARGGGNGLVAKTNEFCTTENGQRSVRHIPTYTTTVTLATITDSVLSTVRPTVTQTIPGRTFTRTSFCGGTVTTTLSASGPTFQPTRTVYQYTTTIVTDAITVSLYTALTTTTGDGTSTVPTPSGFVPAGPSAGPPFQAPFVRRQGRPQSLDFFNFPTPTIPTAVECTAKVTVFTSTTAVVTAGPTITTQTRPKPVLTTLCLTSTSTVLARRASRTIWHTTTSVITLTQYASVSTTSTVVFTTSTVSATPTATYYAACGPENMLSTLPGGDSISSINVRSPNFNNNHIRAISQYDCCVACMTNPTCDFAIFNIGNDDCSRAGQCFQISQNGPGVCPQRFPFVQAVHSDECPGTIGISNGPCGTISF